MRICFGPRRKAEDSFSSNFKWNLKDFIPVFNWWQEVILDAPNHITCHIVLSGKKKLTFAGYSTGTEDQLWNWFQPSAYEVFKIPNPMHQNVTTMRYMTSILEESGLSSDQPQELLNDNLRNYYFKHISAFAYKNLAIPTSNNLISDWLSNPDCK